MVYRFCGSTKKSRPLVDQTVTQNKRVFGFKIKTQLKTEVDRL